MLKRHIFICFILPICWLVVFLIPNKAVVADTDSVGQIVIEVLPSDSLFNITNMKPGDWAPRTVTIQNNGQREFEYQLRVVNDGSNKLFNELIFEVNDQNNKLYHGKLGDFKTIPLRSLASSSQEELDLMISFPKESGNDFQGLHAQFSLIFTAEGKENKTIISSTNVKGVIGSDGDDLHVSGARLPHTATNIFKFLFIGLLTLIVGGTMFEMSRRKMNSLNE